ncbi:LysR family transcriptional regulator [Neisseriaceae bacterium JH1-16]|nr:LysR family transcriptional regulator [Neisseriaceae bacterium JH1-16]
MHDMEWDDLRYFLAVHRAGSLSAAARRLGVNHSTVLRRLDHLETRLGVRLFERLHSGYLMTAAGEALREELDGVGEQIEAAQRRLAGHDAQLSGTLRLTSTDTLVPLLMPHLAAFRRAYPGIQLQLVTGNSFLSLTQREADVAVRPTSSPPDNLIGRRLGRLQTAPYAASSYLAGRAAATGWAEHDWVAPDDSLAHLAQAAWLRRQVPAERIVFSADSLVGMVDAVRHGLGVGMLLCLLAEADPPLVRLAEPDPALDTPLWLLTHPDLKRVARIRAFCDFLQERLSEEPLLGKAPG